MYIHEHKSVAHLISRSHNTLHEYYGEQPCLSTRVDTTQSMTMLAISKHSRAIASEGSTTIVGVNVTWQLTRTKHGILFHYKQIILEQRVCTGGVGATCLTEAATEMQHVNTNIFKQVLNSEGERERLAVGRIVFPFVCHQLFT